MSKPNFTIDELIEHQRQMQEQERIWQETQRDLEEAKRQEAANQKGGK
jgi:hypothetical protein